MSFNYTLKKLDTTIDTLEFIVSKEFCEFIKDKDDGMWKSVEAEKPNNLYKINNTMTKDDFIKKMKQYNEEFNSINDEYIICDNKYMNINTVPNIKWKNIKYESDKNCIFNFKISKKFIKYCVTNGLGKDIKFGDNINVHLDNYWNNNFLYNDTLYIGYDDVCDKELTQNDFKIIDCKKYQIVNYELCEKFVDTMNQLVKVYESDQNDQNY